MSFCLDFPKEFSSIQSSEQNLFSDLSVPINDNCQDLSDLFNMVDPLNLLKEDFDNISLPDSNPLSRTSSSESIWSTDSLEEFSGSSDSEEFFQNVLSDFAEQSEIDDSCSENDEPLSPESSFVPTGCSISPIPESYCQKHTIQLPIFA